MLFLYKLTMKLDVMTLLLSGWSHYRLTIYLSLKNFVVIVGEGLINRFWAPMSSTGVSRKNSLYTILLYAYLCFQYKEHYFCSSLCLWFYFIPPLPTNIFPCLQATLYLFGFSDPLTALPISISHRETLNIF